MSHFLLTALAICLLALPLSLRADPQPIDNTVPPCDQSSATQKPPCSTDSKSLAVPPSLPTERDSVIVPPEIPAEGLPDRSQKPGGDIQQPAKPSQH